MKMWNRKSGYLFVGEVPLLYVLLNIYLHIIYIYMYNFVFFIIIVAASILIYSTTTIVFRCISGAQHAKNSCHQAASAMNTHTTHTFTLEMQLSILHDGVVFPSHCVLDDRCRGRIYTVCLY